MEKTLLEDQYFKKAKDLEIRYPHLQFKNHCFWRIALDNTLKAKWEDVIEHPAYTNLSAHALQTVVSWLEAYWADEKLLLLHNEKSMTYRKMSESTT